MASSLRASASATRLLRSSAFQTQSILPAARRYESSSSSSVPARKKEDSPLATPRSGAPIYNSPVDHATSYD